METEDPLASRPVFWRGVESCQERRERRVVILEVLISLFKGGPETEEDSALRTEWLVGSWAKMVIASVCRSDTERVSMTWLVEVLPNLSVDLMLVQRSMWRRTVNRKGAISRDRKNKTKKYDLRGS